jgi:lipid-binding SYLF domain-containing protein
MKKINFKVLLLALLIGFSTLATAKSAKELDHDANVAINKFINENPSADAFLVKSKAFLVFPDVKEGGMMIGGRYAEGVLREGRTTKGYYKMTSASIGMQMGAQKYSMIIAFTTEASLNSFLLNNDEWDTEIESRIAIADWNSKEEIDKDYKEPMVAFIFDSKGMMGSFTFEGTKFEKMNK